MSIKTPELISQVYHRVLSYSLARFVVVGLIGFVVNYVVLAILYDKLGLSIVPSQLIGAELALLSTFAGNNFWAFRDHHHIPIRTKLIKYHITSGTAIVITSSTVILLVHSAHFYYGLALVISACIGLVWNFIFNSKVIFKKKRAEETDQN